MITNINKKLIGIAGVIFLVASAILFAFLFNFFNNDNADQSYAAKNTTSISSISNDEDITVALSPSAYANGWTVSYKWTGWVGKNTTNENDNSQNYVALPKSENYEKTGFLSNQEVFKVYETIKPPQPIDYSKSWYGWSHDPLLSNGKAADALDLKLGFSFKLADGNTSGTLVFIFETNGSKFVTESYLYVDKVQAEYNTPIAIPSASTTMMAPIWEDAPVPVSSYKITGSVYDERHGQTSPLAGVNVNYRADNNDIVTYTTTTLADGTFIIDNINANNLHGFLDFDLDEFQFHSIEIFDNEFNEEGVCSVGAVPAMYAEFGIYFGPYCKQISLTYTEYDEAGKIVYGPEEEIANVSSLFSMLSDDFEYNLTLMDDFTLVLSDYGGHKLHNELTNYLDIIEMRPILDEGHAITSVSLNDVDMENNLQYKLDTKRRNNVVYNYDEQPVVPPVDPDPVVEEEFTPADLELTAQTADPVSMNAICVLAFVFFVSWTIFSLKRSRVRRRG